jgi:hypothetical protein
MQLDVSDPQAFAADPAAKQSVANTIAAIAGVPQNFVTVELSVPSSRRLTGVVRDSNSRHPPEILTKRRLQANGVQVDYVIAMPVDATTELDTLPGVQEALTTISEDAMTALMVAEISSQVGSGTYILKVLDMSAPIINAPTVTTSITSTTITYKLASFQATDQLWSDYMSFSFPDRRFARQGIWDGNTDAGSWSLSGDTLTLTWDAWGTTILTTSDKGLTFASSGSSLRLEGSTPPDWWRQLFDMCTFILTLSRTEGSDFTVEVPGKSGDSFQIGSCRPDEFCSSNGWGVGFNVIVDQDGVEVAKGSCCSEVNDILTITSTCSEAAAIVAHGTYGVDSSSAAGNSLTAGLIGVVGASVLLVCSVVVTRRCYKRCQAGKETAVDSDIDAAVARSLAPISFSHNPQDVTDDEFANMEVDCVMKQWEIDVWAVESEKSYGPDEEETDSNKEVADDEEVHDADTLTSTFLSGLDPSEQEKVQDEVPAKSTGPEVPRKWDPMVPFAAPPDGSGPEWAPRRTPHMDDTCTGPEIPPKLSPLVTSAQLSKCIPDVTPRERPTSPSRRIRGELDEDGEDLDGDFGMGLPEI